MVRSIDLRGTVEVAKHSGSDFDDLKCETHYFRWILMIDIRINELTPGWNTHEQIDGTQPLDYNTLKSM